MKILKVLAVLILLVGLPAGSWYYLKSGFTVRKSAIDDLEIKEPFPSALINQNDLLKECLENNVSILYKNESNASALRSEIEEIHTIFKHRDRFSLIGVELKKDSISGPVSELGEDWKLIGLEKQQYELIPFSSEELIVLDTLANIRGSYLMQKEDIQRMAKQITILFPVEKSKKIRLKRDVPSQ